MSGTELTVLYDEGCGFCARVAGWLGRHGVTAEPIGSATGEHGLRDLRRDERYAFVHVLDGDGRRYSGGAALPPLLHAVPRLGWAAVLLERFPGVAAWGYELVASRRSALSRLLRAGPRARRASRGRAG